MSRLFFYNGIREFFNSRIFRIAGSGESLIESFPGKTIKFHTFLSLLLSVFQNAFGIAYSFFFFTFFSLIQRNVVAENTGEGTDNGRN